VPPESESRGAACLRSLTMQNSLIACGIAFPVAFYMKKPWPIAVGFLAGTIADLVTWKACMEDKPIKVVEPAPASLSHEQRSQDAAARRAAVDFDAFERTKGAEEKRGDQGERTAGTTGKS